MFAWVENLVLREIEPDNDNYPEHYKITDILTIYADGVDYCQRGDEKWYNESHINLCRGFNHLKNFMDLCQLTSYQNKKIKIIESFLVLETLNGILRI